VRTNRHLLRLFFLVVILMGLFGGWWVDRRWQEMTQDVAVELPSDTDWVSLVADLAENGMRFFQGATSDAE
jgi:hypothetical protein